MPLPARVSSTPRSRWPRVLLYGSIVLAVVGGLYRFVLTEHRGPREMVEAVREARKDPLFDERAALLELSDALEGAERAHDEALKSEILRLRSEILLVLGARSEARAALTQALEECDPEDRALELYIAILCDEDGEEDEASARADRLIEKAPDFGPAWVLRGRVLGRRADGLLQAAKASLQRRLLDRELVDGLALVEHMASIDVEEPRRNADLVRLRELFGSRREDQYEETASLAEQASRVRTDARHAHARSFQMAIEPEAVAALVRDLSRADEPQWSIDLGTTARYDDLVRRDWSVAQALIDPLRRLGDSQRLALLFSDWNWSAWPAPGEFYESVCMALYDAGTWHLLSGPIERMRRTHGARGQALGNYLSGMSSYGRGRNTSAIPLLDLFTSAKESYYPGDMAAAWYALADMYREDGKKELERQALKQATTLLPEADGEAWLRLAQVALQSLNAGYREAEEDWTIGMNLLPARTAELEPQWLALSDQVLTANRRSFDEAVRDARMQGRTTPSFDIGPSTTYRFAKLAFDEAHYDVSLRLARDLLEEYPALLPAVDLAFESMILLKDYGNAAAMALHRLELVGRDEATLSALARVGANHFTPEQVVQAMRADPDRTGRLVVIRGLNQSGRHEEALRAIPGSTQPSKISDVELRLEAAKAFLGLEQAELAHEALSGLETNPFVGEQAVELEVRLSLQDGDREQWAALVERLRRPRLRDRGLLMTVASELAARGELGLARQALRTLDSDRSLRGGDVLLAMARIEMADGNDDAASEALMRAEAFDLGGEVERARLLLAIDQRRWIELPDLVERARAASGAHEDFEDAIYSLLGEDLAAGARQAREGQILRPKSVEWQLVHAVARSLAGSTVNLDAHFGGRRYLQDLEEVLRGGGENVRDPRELLALLMVIDRPEWTPWTLTRLRRLDPSGGGSVWTLYLGARMLFASGNAEEAERRLNLMVRRFPRFGPAWELLEQALTARTGDPFSPDVRLLRAEAAERLGDPLDPLLAAISSALDLADQGEPEQARELLMLELGKRPQSNIGREVLARLHAETGHSRMALAEYQRAIAGTEGKRAAKLVGELLALLRRPEVVEEVALDGRRALVTDLAQRFPDHPLVALARARLELERDPNNRGITLGLAHDILVRFRSTHANRSLDAILPGSTLPWFEFLSEQYPSAAEGLIRQEIAANPGDVELWLTWARFLEQSSRVGEALAIYRDVAAMCNSSQAHLGAARLLGQGAANAREAERHLQAAQALGDEGIDRAVEYYRARAQLGDEGVPLEPAIEVLERTWRERSEIDTGIPELELGFGLAHALLLRRGEADLERIDELFDELEGIASGALAHDYLLALEGIASHVEPAPVSVPTLDEESGEGEGEGESEATATGQEETGAEAPAQAPKQKPGAKPKGSKAQQGAKPKGQAKGGKAAPPRKGAGKQGQGKAKPPAGGAPAKGDG